MAWCFLMVLTVGVACRGTAAQDCPQLGLTGSAFQEAEGQVSLASVLYLCTTPLGSQCSGSISEVEFCYQPAPMAATDRIFTVVTLKPMGMTFRVVTRSDICAAQADSCTMDPIIAGVQRCCATRRLEPVVEVTQDSVYGIETPLANINNTLLLFANISRPGRILSLSGVSSDVNATLPPDQPPDQSSSNASVAMVRFIVNVTPSPSPTSQPANPSGRDTTPTANPPAAATVSTAPHETTSTHSPPQATVGPPTGQSGDQDLVPIGIGVALGAVVALVILFMVVAVVVVQRKRKRKGVYDTKLSQGNGITNALYTAAAPVGDNDIIDPSMQVGLPNSNTNDLKKGPELPHEYAMPDEIQGARIIDGPQGYTYPTTGTNTKKVATSSNEYSYATIEGRGMKLMPLSKEGIYEVPARDENSLYAQFEKIRVRQIQRNAVKTAAYLGSGQFGTVTRGEWESPDGPIEVAMKTLKTGAAQVDKVKFLQEAAIMGQFQHNSVVKLYGVVLSGEPVMIVLELLAKGDLREHLLSLGPEPGKKVEDLEHTLLSYCRQIAFGMDYLSQKAFVHRDLAARNILVAEDGTCKVADFGMARDLENENYYISSGGKIPVKWTAPEAIHFKKYSTASDVWSYGALMYEIWSLGHKPFKGYTNNEAIKLIDGGYRLPPPPGCPKAIYEIMIKAWHQKASERPSFTDIVQWLSSPDPQLLRWSEEDRAVHPQAALLGAELEAAEKLYKELQDTYHDNADSGDYVEQLTHSSVV